MIPQNNKLRVIPINTYYTIRAAQQLTAEC